MIRRWKIIQVFISSTFSDMHTERDYLVRTVFPELKEKCHRHHVHLIDVDLRWGVSESDAQDGRALDICLDEIDFCRPYFLGLIGNRYGWIPAGQENSITAQEIYHAALHNNIPRQVINLQEIIKGKLEDKYLTDVQIKSLVHNYRWDEEKNKYLLKDNVSTHEAAIIRSVFKKYSTYRNDRCIFLFRSEFLTEKLAGKNKNDFFEVNKVNQKRMTALKQAIIEAGLPYIKYDDIETFGEKVKENIWRWIEADLEKPIKEHKDWLDEEEELHELFMANRTHRFEGRREILDKMHFFCTRDEEPSVMVITGEPGSGKSALMSRFCEEVIRDNPDWLIIPHFVGASSHSTNIAQTLRRLCARLNSIANLLEEIPQEYKQLIKVFPKLLAKAAEQKKILIILDAINQLEKSNNAHSMRWLPQKLPGSVKMFISMTPCESFETLLASRIKISIEKLSGLHETEINKLIGNYLKEIRRKFPNKQVQKAFFDKVKTGNPLYILVALEELRVFGQFEKFSDRIDKLPENVVALFDQVLERIESDLNPALVRDCMIFVACARQGMAAHELQILLSAHAPSTKSEFKPEKLPDMVWARLYRAFSTYLFERSGVIDFFHNQFYKAVENRYLKEGQLRSEVHRQLADFFYNKIDPTSDSTWGGNYPRSLSELTYHLYHFAVLSGEPQRFLKVVDDWSFKQKQFEHFGTPEQLTIDIEYALDLAVRKCEPVRLVQYAIMRSKLSHTLFRSNLSRLVSLAKDKQELVHGVIKLLPDLSHRRIGLVLLAWMFRDDNIQKNFVKDLLRDALSIDDPVSICQIPVMLEMVLGLYNSGFNEAKGIIDMIPHCPLRQAYQKAWLKSPGLDAEFSSQFSSGQKHQFIASPVEIEEFIGIEEFVRQSLQNPKTFSHWESFENQMADTFGPDAVPGIYFLLAAEKMQSGINHMAEGLINRGIYFFSAVTKHYIRTLSALVEAFGKAGEHDMAEEHAERVRTYAKLLRRITKTGDELERLEDALSELTISTERLVEVWRPMTTKDMFERSLAGRRFQKSRGEGGPLSLLTNARMLLAEGHVQAISPILKKIITKLKDEKNIEQFKAVMLSLYAMAGICQDKTLMSMCSSQLKDHNLHPEALFVPGQPNKETLTALETLADSDSRCISPVALSLRLAGLTKILFEFLRISSNLGADEANLDAIMSELVRLPDLSIPDLRKISDEILSTSKFMVIPQGLGWYYFPGIMLSALWSGVVLTSTGFTAALSQPVLLVIGALLLLAGAVGGLADLVVWRAIGLWEKPEKSRRIISEIASLVSLWATFPLIRLWFTPKSPTTIIIGCLIALLLEVSFMFILGRRGLLFSPLRRKTIAVGTGLAIIIAAIFGCLTAISDVGSSSILKGIFIVGVLSLSLAINILPKRRVVMQKYKEKGDFEEHESLSLE